MNSKQTEVIKLNSTADENLKSAVSPMETDDGDDDLLVACETPQRVESISGRTSESSSIAGDNPEDSSDEKQRSTERDCADCDRMEKSAVVPQNAEEFASESNRNSPKKVEFKMNFLRKFSSAVGVLKRAELEELLIQKITESLIFSSENVELSKTVKEQEQSCVKFKKQLEYLNQKYSELTLIHKRLIEDMKARPTSPVPAKKISRSVGMQVFIPILRTKHKSQPTNTQSNNTQPSTNPVSNKRPVSELGRLLNENTFETAKRNKTSEEKETVQGAPEFKSLNDQMRSMLEKQKVKKEQDLIKLFTGPNTIKISPNITITSNGPSTSASQSSIDLTEDKGSKQIAPVKIQPPINTLNCTPRVGFVSKSTLTDQRSNSQIARALNIQHPAPLPQSLVFEVAEGMKKIPPQPSVKVTSGSNSITVLWEVPGYNSDHAEISSYQIYAYEVTHAIPKTENWKKLGDVNAIRLPMSVVLNQFRKGQKYFFSVRAVDIHKRIGFFSVPRTWLEKGL